MIVADPAWFLQLLGRDLVLALNILFRLLRWPLVLEVQLHDLAFVFANESERSDTSTRLVLK